MTGGLLLGQAPEDRLQASVFALQRNNVPIVLQSQFQQLFFHLVGLFRLQLPFLVSDCQDRLYSFSACNLAGSSVSRKATRMVPDPLASILSRLIGLSATSLPRLMITTRSQRASTSCRI